MSISAQGASPKLNFVLCLGFFALGLVQLPFVFTLIVNATPITDEYCFAFTSREFGVLESFVSWNKTWSPSLGYLPTLWLWSLQTKTLLIPIIMIALSTSTLIALLAITLKFGTSLEGGLNWLRATAALFFAIVIVVSLIPSHSFLLYSSSSDSLIHLIKVSIITLLSFDRDGQLLHWFFSISLSWQKVIFGSLLGGTVVLTNYVLNRKVSPIWLSVVGIIFLLYGPNTESVIFFVFLFSLVFFDLFKTKILSRSSIMFFFLLGCFLAASTLVEGSKFRQDKFADVTVTTVFQRSLPLLFQMISLHIPIIIATFSIAFLCKLTFGIEGRHYHAFPAKTMLVSAIISNFIVGNLVYISTYHWISLIVIAFSSLFHIFLNSNLPCADSVIHRLFLGLLLLMISYVSLGSIKSAAEYSEVRRFEIQQRFDTSKNQRTISLRQIPVKDNQNRIFVYDLSPDAYGIAPTLGWSKGVAIKCFKRLT